jgi:hypothetical protein
MLFVGPPIVSDQTVVLKGSELLLSSLFYSVPHPENPIWYAAGNVLPLGKKYRSSTLPTKIVLILININICFCNSKIYKHCNWTCNDIRRV